MDMDNNETNYVPYIVHEGQMARMERTIKRLWVICIILIVLFVGTNAGWIWYESQFIDETITQEISQDSGDGGSNTYSGKMIGGDYYGETDDKNYDTPQN